MAIVSVTRLHVRAWRLVPTFFLAAYRSAKQARNSQGFLTGCLAVEPPTAFWTVTIWEDEAAMRSFRNAGIHLHTMPKLLGWCDEASYVHWTTESMDLPSMPEAHQRLGANGKLSKVTHPSAAQQAGHCAPGGVPRAGQLLAPRRPR